MSKKDKDIIDKFFNFLKKEVSPPVKKDFKWLKQAEGRIAPNLWNNTPPKPERKRRKRKTSDEE